MLSCSFYHVPRLSVARLPLRTYRGATGWETHLGRVNLINQNINCITGAYSEPESGNASMIGICSVRWFKSPAKAPSNPLPLYDPCALVENTVHWMDTCQGLAYRLAYNP